MLEAKGYKDNCFATLTYNDENLPFVDTSLYGGPGPLPSLLPSDTQLWLKRLRKALSPITFRFFLAGEYGDENWRPHYHVALFNVPTCRRGVTGFGMVRGDWRKCCGVCQLVGETWGKGNIYLGTLEDHSAQYICGYVTKKMTRRDHWKLLGREPEFSRQSNRGGGLGKAFMWEYASELMRLGLDQSQGDVPVTLRHGRRELPLGRYLVRCLREMVGKEANAPASTIEKLHAELQPLRQTAFENSRSFKKEIQHAQAGQIASFHSRLKIFKRRGSL